MRWGESAMGHRLSGLEAQATVGADGAVGLPSQHAVWRLARWANRGPSPKSVTVGTDHRSGLDRQALLELPGVQM